MCKYKMSVVLEDDSDLAQPELKLVEEESTDLVIEIPRPLKRPRKARVPIVPRTNLPHTHQPPDHNTSLSQ